MAGATRRIRLTRSIVLNRKHAKEGDVFDVPAPLAHNLVGDGSAEFHEDSAEEVAAENRAGVKVHDPHSQSGDPQIKQVSDAPKDAKGGKSKSA